MKIRKKLLSLGMASFVILGSASAYAAPTHIVVGKKAYKFIELVTPNYISAMMSDIASGGSIYIADNAGEGKTVSISDLISGNYDTDIKNASNKAGDIVGPIKEVNGDLSEGSEIVLPGLGVSEEDFVIESIE